MSARFDMDLIINIERALYNSISEQTGRILPECDKRQDLVVVSPYGMCSYKIRKKRKSV